MYNWNILKEHKEIESLFYAYFKWQKYDAYLNLFYSQSSDVLGGESVEYDEVVEFFEQHKILLNVRSYYSVNKIYYQTDVYNHLDNSTRRSLIHHHFSDREEAQKTAIDMAINILNDNLTSISTKIKFKHQNNVENNVKEFFN